MADLAKDQQADIHLGPVYKLLQSRNILTDIVPTSEDSWETRKLKRMLEHLYLDNDGTMMARLPLEAGGGK
jgi:hypothetical protein